jgi:hypothetical protein
VLFFTILYGRNKWGQVWIYQRQLDNLTKHWKITIYQKELCFYCSSLHSYLLIVLCHWNNTLKQEWSILSTTYLKKKWTMLHISLTLIGIKKLVGPLNFQLVICKSSQNTREVTCKSSHNTREVTCGSSPDKVKPKTMKLVFVASLLSMQH